MPEYNIDYLLTKLESKLEHFEENFMSLRQDVKEIQGGMSDLKQLTQLIERMGTVEERSNKTVIEMAELKVQFNSFKDMVEKERIGVKDMWKSIGWAVAIIVSLISVILGM